ncbi:MAG: carbohydrate kinase, partial [Planctomycetia bacterium]|nr:carbohydrate kinase [Planctomycetia bacterium]
ADSRTQIEHFKSVCLKPNEKECENFYHRGYAGIGWHEDFEGHPAWGLAHYRSGRPVFCTRGNAGIALAFPDEKLGVPTSIPAYPVSGPIDIVGAGDSTSAGIACAMAAGATHEQAAAFGCLIASITIQQLGTTGSASPEQVRQRWRQVQGERRA